MSSPISHVVVTPVYEDVEAFARLCRELRAALGAGTHVVAVDDGSVRRPVDPQVIRAAGLSGTVLRLRRNVGHQRAIAIGLGHVAETLPNHRVVVMDSDGEDVPATIPELLIALDAGDVDVCVAVRTARVETLRFKLFYLVYKLLFRLMTGRWIAFGNFMALTPAAVRRLAAMRETWTHVAATVLVSKLRVATRPLSRGPRYAGQSKMNFAGLVLHGFRAVMVFTEDVLVRTGIVSAAIALSSMVASVVSVVLKSSGHATPGWFSVALGILLILFLQTSALTLMTLLLTGLVRGGEAGIPDHRVLIDEAIEV